MANTIPKTAAHIPPLPGFSFISCIIFTALDIAKNINNNVRIVSIKTVENVPVAPIQNPKVNHPKNIDNKPNNTGNPLGV